MARAEEKELWGVETRKAVENFPVSGEPIPAPVARWLGRIKAAAARVNAELGLLDLARLRVLDRHRLDAPVAVDLAHLARREDPHAALALERARLVHRRLERPEVVAAVDERDRRLRRVLQPERPVQRRVAAADDHARAVAEDVLFAHEVMDALVLPRLDPLDPELAWLEGAVAGGDDQRAGEVGAALVGADREELLAVLAHAFQRLHLLAEQHLGAVLEPLLGAELDQLRAEDLRVAGDVVDVLLRVDRGDLAAELLEALDDSNRGIAMAGVVRSRQARRACSEDGDVGDAVIAHGVKC